jgi:hypothetical protein
MALEQLCHMLVVFVNQWDMKNDACVENSMLPVLEILLAIAQNSLVSNEIHHHLVVILFLGSQYLFFHVVCNSVLFLHKSLFIRLRIDFLFRCLFFPDFFISFAIY